MLSCEAQLTLPLQSVPSVMKLLGQSQPFYGFSLASLTPAEWRKSHKHALNH